MKDHVLTVCSEELAVQDPKLLHPVVLAYIGDAVFSLYVRLRRLRPMCRCSTNWLPAWYRL
jgi:23S rRNA maturation mini-RNase III